jgi:transposase InsO family protein
MQEFTVKPWMLHHRVHSLELIKSLTMVRVNGYKTKRSHGSLGYLAPVQFALMHGGAKNF